MAGPALASTETNLIRIVAAINSLFQGRSNAGGTVTLTTLANTTTVTAANCGSNSMVVLEAMTATAASEKQNGALYVSAVNKGSFVVTHANNGLADRTFRFVCLG